MLEFIFSVLTVLLLAIVCAIGLAFIVILIRIIFDI